MKQWEELLSKGNWQQFYSAFEERFDLFPDLKRQRDALPAEKLWHKGQSVENKKLVIWCEQGRGDNLQFLRYLPLIRCREITVCCYPQLAPLVECQEYVDGICLKRWPKDFDLHCSLLSLPYLLDLDHCPTSPFISSPGGITYPAGFRVGICWCGNAEYPADRIRSCPLSAFAPIFAIPDIQVWSLVVDRRQRKYIGDERIYDLAEHPGEWVINDAGPFLSDWYDTACWVNGLDMVISVDTALVHLAAGMGKRTIALLPFDSCWRWGGRWYDTLTVLKQEQPGEWEPVLERAADLVIQSKNVGQLPNLVP